MEGPSPLLIQLIFAAFPTLMACAMINVTLRSKPLKWMVLGLLIFVDVLHTLYLVVTLPPHSEYNNETYTSTFDRNGNENTRIMWTTFGVGLLKVCVSALLALCIYLCKVVFCCGEKATTEVPESAHGTGSSMETTEGPHSQSLTSSEELPPTYDTVIRMSSNANGCHLVPDFSTKVMTYGKENKLKSTSLIRPQCVIASTVIAYGMIANCLKWRSTKLVVLGTLIILEVLVSIYLVATSPSLQDSNGSGNSEPRRDHDETWRIIKITFIVIGMKICAGFLLGYCNRLRKEIGEEATTEVS